MFRLSLHHATMQHEFLHPCTHCNVFGCPDRCKPKFRGVQNVLYELEVRWMHFLSNIVIHCPHIYSPLPCNGIRSSCTMFFFFCIYSSMCTSVCVWDAKFSACEVKKLCTASLSNFVFGLRFLHFEFRNSVIITVIWQGLGVHWVCKWLWKLALGFKAVIFKTLGMIDCWFFLRKVLKKCLNFNDVKYYYTCLHKVVILNKCLDQIAPWS